MTTVIDASVAIKWFVKDEPGKTQAMKVLDGVRDDPSDFVVPELFFNEMLAVLVRLLPNKPKEAKDYVAALEGLGLYRIGNGHELLATAVELALKHKLTGYDAIYAACAKLTKGTWLTADTTAHRKISKLKLSRVLR